MRNQPSAVNNSALAEGFYGNRVRVGPSAAISPSAQGGTSCPASSMSLSPMPGTERPMVPVTASGSSVTRVKVWKPGLEHAVELDQVSRDP